MPAAIFDAIIEHASSPLEHCQFTAATGVETGIPAINPAILEETAPAPGYKTLPI